jgi:hypothetical protein
MRPSLLLCFTSLLACTPPEGDEDTPTETDATATETDATSTETDPVDTEVAPPDPDTDAPAVDTDDETPGAANLLSNGDFEDPEMPDGTAWDAPYPPGWAAMASTASDWAWVRLVANAGNQAVEVNVNCYACEGAPQINDQFVTVLSDVIESSGFGGRECTARANFQTVSGPSLGNFDISLRILRNDAQVAESTVYSPTANGQVGAVTELLPALALGSDDELRVEITVRQRSGLSVIGTTQHLWYIDDVTLSCTGS